jgi:Rps23 Pro-64 3,4-dihydroxylase Tpa1-like proline 4-hydroxylase
LVSFLDFKRSDIPFTHWVDTHFLTAEQVKEVNKGWVDSSDKRWHHERRDYSKKSALMFPNRLHDSAQSLATELYSDAKVAELSELTGIKLLPDPWFTDGPLMPRVGGGLHEIHPGGALKMHVDFSVHPTGLTRALNLLIYLNQEWQDGWAGALELGDGQVKIRPYGGTAVIFETTGTSWHGHPTPLACPPHKTRRSLALYYYSETEPDTDRPTTVYRNK